MILSDDFLRAWEADATYFKNQPGLISTQLHKGIGASGTFINYAIWESTAQFKKAVYNTDLQTRLSNYPASTVVSPHIFSGSSRNLCGVKIVYCTYNLCTEVMY
jgi:hypothetical protein